VADNRPVVVVISEDPRVSHRANEAMRIGLGIVAGENEVVFVLRGPAVELLAEDTDELIDGDDIARFRANLKSLSVPFHVEAEAVPTDPSWNPERHPVVSVTRAEIAGLVGRGRRVLVF
jgi:radical SAM superfamily enzyme YgiQ (UPF0313 family)